MGEYKRYIKHLKSEKEELYEKLYDSSLEEKRKILEKIGLIEDKLENFSLEGTTFFQFDNE